MYLFQPSPSRPPRSPARIRATPVDSSWQQEPLTLSDIVLVKRHKSAGARIRQPRPRASSTTLAPFQRQESHSRPGTAPPRDAYGSRPDNPRPRPVTAPYPRLPSDTVSTSTTHPRSPNPALVHLLATKPPPPPPPHQHQRSASLHPQPPPLRLRTSFSSAHPAPNSDADMHSSTNPQSRISRHPRPTSAYGPSTMTAKPNLATNTRPFPSVPPPIQKSKSQPPQFSTADRTILEELKRNISAKAAQFVIKGSTQGGITGGTVIGMGKRGGGRHHPFRKEDVPYPRCYEREAIDLDIWETAFCEQFCESLTWHAFEEPPTKVLDIGSGTGTWILKCARLWKKCHFVGLDIVPLHPDLQQVGSSDLASRITWVQENFLHGLPFPNDEFDFVHIKRIARGVPEDKWDSLFEEITRVMKPGGAFEMLEEDLFFPGKDPDSDDADWSDSEFQSCFEPIQDDVYTSPATTPITNVGPTISAATFPFSTSATTLPPTPPRSTSPSPLLSLTRSTAEKNLPPLGSESSRQSEPQSRVSFLAGKEPEPHSPDVYHVPPLQHPQPSSKHKPPGTHRHFQLHMPSRPVLRSKSTSSASTASLFGARPPSSESACTKARLSTSSSLTSSTIASTSGATNAAVPAVSHLTPTGRLPEEISPLLKMRPKRPANPRDHRLLELIYTEMHAARFINLSPLSLLTNTLGLYFRDVRTHPPLQFTFPPRRTRRGDYVTSEDGGVASASKSDGDDDDAQNTVHDLGTIKAHQNDYQWLSSQNLLERCSPYAQLDDTRTSAFSPSPKASFPAISPAGGMMAFPSRLPNPTVHFDLRTLNLHLALRTADTLACAEAMWEWVADYQASQAALERERNRGSVDGRGPGRRSQSPMMWRAIKVLTRAEFDELLTKFDLDMRDHMGLEHAIEERFMWCGFSKSPSAERKVFDFACDKWAQWEAEQQREQRPRPPKRHTSPDHATPITAEPMLQRRSSTSAITPRLDADSHSGNPTPARRLSRAVRVFVAWKA